MDAQTNTVTEPEVVCNHKPGDVWADGCCTSKKNKTTVVSDDATDTLDTSADESSQTINYTKD